MKAWVILPVLAAAQTDQNTSTIPGIIDTCYAFLESHLCQGTKWDLGFHFYEPSLEKYSADQCKGGCIFLHGFWCCLILRHELV